MFEVQPAKLVRESSIQLLKYSLYICVSHLLIFKSQKGSIHALNFFSELPHKTLNYLKTINCYWDVIYIAKNWPLDACMSAEYTVEPRLIDTPEMWPFMIMLILAWSRVHLHRLIAQPSKRAKPKF